MNLVTAMQAPRALSSLSPLTRPLRAFCLGLCCALLALAAPADAGAAGAAETAGVAKHAPPKANSSMPWPDPVVLTVPADKTRVTLPTTVPLTATVSDSVIVKGVVSVVSVTFHDGTTSIGSVSQPPYAVNWVNPSPGIHTLTATLVDSSGGISTSAPVTVTVLAHPAPTVSLTAPADGASHASLAPLTLTAAAATTAPETTIAQVAFFAGTTLIGTASQAPYTTTWNTPTAGTHLLTAKATDSTGATATSAPVTVTFSAETQGVFFIHPDHLGTPRLIADQQQRTVWRWENEEAFGDNAPEEDPGNTGQKFEFNLRFPGQYFDKETGLSYNYFRDYEASTGRYTTSDPIGLRGGINTYSYVRGNPLGLADPLGLDATDWWNSTGGRDPVANGPTNGNWGGKCWSGGKYSCGGNSPGNAQPTDSGDACYKRHDDCYVKCGASQRCIADCDKTLVGELRQLPNDPRKWPQPPKPGTEGDSRRYRAAAISYFE